MNYKTTPKTGRAILFFNLNDNNDDVRIKALHGGLPIGKGEKWICNKWIRLNKIEN